MNETNGSFPFQSVPKIELHVHLDCSLSYAFVGQYHEGLDREQFRREYALVSKCRDLCEFLQLVPRSLQWMQTAERLRLSVLDMARQLQADQVIYAEVRFAPLLHLKINWNQIGLWIWYVGRRMQRPRKLALSWV